MPIRVLCLDDNADLMEVLRLSIDRTGDLQMVACIDCADQLVDEVRRTQPDVAVVDLTMPGKEPLEAVRELSDAFPGVKTLAYSGYDDPETINQALEAGAWALVSKNQPIDAVLRAIRDVAALS
ncbi:MAG TPA: response regulator transcription factor [Phycisphaerales bacterium]|nr:response regulator transcription factor [Phycisphaerales bacterium]